MKYKIVLSDIDGTLINSRHFVSKKTKNVLQGLDIPVVLVSARMPQGITIIQKQFSNHDPIICYSGALVLNDEQVIYDVGIDKKEAKVLYDDLIEDEKISVSAYCYDFWYSERYDKWIEQEEKITSLKAIIDSFEKENKVHKFLCMSEPENIDRLELKLKKKYPHLSIYKSKSTYLEIMSGNVSKLTAIQALLEYYRISLNECLSFGDNYNDLDMLKNTGMSFAMANAPEQIKKEIGRVTKSNDEDGVAYALENLI